MVNHYKREKVDHHKLNCHHKCDKEDRRILGAAIVALRTVRTPCPRVVHEVVPTFSRGQDKHELDCVVEVNEAFVLVEGFTLPLRVDSAEEEHAEHRKNEEYKAQENEHIHYRPNSKRNGRNQSLEAFIFAC